MLLFSCAEKGVDKFHRTTGIVRLASWDIWRDIRVWVLQVLSCHSCLHLVLRWHVFTGHWWGFFESTGSYQILHGKGIPASGLSVTLTVFIVLPSRSILSISGVTF